MTAFEVWTPKPQINDTNAMNEVTLVPTKIVNVCWCDCQQLTGDELERTRQVVPTATHSLVMDAGDLKKLGLDTKSWFVFHEDRNRKLYVRSVEDVKEGHFTMRLLCEETQ